jgi:hypothetical protein
VLRGRLRRGAWSRAERQLLKELYGTRSDEDLEVSCSRARADIAGMAAQLCLAKDKRFAAERSRARMPRWSEAEVQRLREVYADRDNLEVARMVGRTVTSVANKANQLGLRKSASLLTDIGRTNVALRYREAGAAQ